MSNGYKHCDICNTVQPIGGWCSNGHLDEDDLTYEEKLHEAASAAGKVLADLIDGKIFDLIMKDPSLVGAAPKCRCGLDHNEIHRSGS